MLVIHATVPVDPDHHEDATARSRNSQKNPERVVDYRATKDVVDPNLFHVFEQYEDEQAFGAHGQSEHYQEFQAAIAEMLAGEPTITRFDVGSVSEVELSAPPERF